MFLSMYLDFDETATPACLSADLFCISSKSQTPTSKLLCIQIPGQFGIYTKVVFTGPWTIILVVLKKRRGPAGIFRGQEWCWIPIKIEKTVNDFQEFSGISRILRISRNSILENRLWNEVFGLFYFERYRFQILVPDSPTFFGIQIFMMGRNFITHLHPMRYPLQQ